MNIAEDDKPAVKNRSAINGFYYIVLIIANGYFGWHILRRTWHILTWYEITYTFLILATGSLFASQLIVLLINKITNQKS